MNELQNVSEEFTATVTRKETTTLPDLNIDVLPGMILGIPIRVDKTEAGVIIPESAQSNNIPRVQIVAINSDLPIKRGDIVHYAPYNSAVPMLNINNVQVLRLYPDEIIGIER